MFIFRYFINVNLGVLKRLGIAGIVFSVGLGEKCDNVWFVGNGFVIELGFHLFVRWYVFLFVCSVLVMVMGLGRDCGVYLGSVLLLGVCFVWWSL